MFVHEEYLSPEETLAKALADTPVIRESLGKEDGIQHHLRNVVQSLHPWVLLRFIAENPAHLELDVKWGFNDVVEGGWVPRESVVKSLSIEQQFLIVTEGSSDTSIISKSLQILRPGVADFFRFVDMSESYPFSGIGNVHNFCKGLICIGHSHPTVFIYDNDTEGTEKFTETQKLNLLANMRVMKLPDLHIFEQFRCVGPNGVSQQNINGRAAAIECYLDLTGKQPAVRWTTYNPRVAEYQGVLEDKLFYAKQFYSITARDTQYDFSKLDIMLNEIVSVYVGIKSVDVAWEIEN
jgi:HEPN superfamily Toprim-like protein